MINRWCPPVTIAEILNLGHTGELPGRLLKREMSKTQSRISKSVFMRDGENTLFLKSFPNDSNVQAGLRTTSLYFEFNLPILMKLNNFINTFF